MEPCTHQADRDEQLSLEVVKFIDAREGGCVGLLAHLLGEDQTALHRRVGQALLEESGHRGRRRLGRCRRTRWLDGFLAGFQREETSDNRQELIEERLRRRFKGGDDASDAFTRDETQLQGVAIGIEMEQVLIRHTHRGRRELIGDLADRLAEIFERSGGVKVERMTAAEGVAHAYRCIQKAVSSKPYLFASP